MVEHLTIGLLFSSIVGVMLGGRLGFVALLIATAITIVMK
jgi:hypothetical protein